MHKIKSLLFCLFSFIFLFLVGCQNSTPKSMENTEPVRIGISWERVFPNNELSEDVQAYVDSVKKVGAIPVLLPQVTNEEDAYKALAMVDALIMTGGEDINPSYYNEKPHVNLEEPKDDRDTSDYWLLKTALKEDYPILGTCRGMQLLNVVLGGTLYQDLPTEYITDIQHRDPKKVDFTKHSCEIIDTNSKLFKMLQMKDLTVNSWHHQAVEKLGNGLKVVAVSPDGIIEGVELDEATFVVGVQFHPEYHVVENDDEFLPIFETLRDYGLKHRNSL